MERGNTSGLGDAVSKPVKDVAPELRLRALLDRVLRVQVRVKSDYARENAEIVAMAASLNLITTRTHENQFALAWLITNRGLSWLHETY